MLALLLMVVGQLLSLSLAWVNHHVVYHEMRHHHPQPTATATRVPSVGLTMPTPGLYHCHLYSSADCCHHCCEQLCCRCSDGCEHDHHSPSCRVGPLVSCRCSFDDGEGSCHRLS